MAERETSASAKVLSIFLPLALVALGALAYRLDFGAYYGPLLAIIWGAAFFVIFWGLTFAGWLKERSYRMGAAYLIVEAGMAVFFGPKLTLIGAVIGLVTGRRP